MVGYHGGRVTKESRRIHKEEDIFEVIVELKEVHLSNNHTNNPSVYMHSEFLLL